ncbi:hypothetical protein Q5424_00940 [Conexibacter sp. JD483]|uniref:ABC transporter permease n=1 Tax=unclassified Conexibacter TaxID=2627773 RepID=UPI002723A274|nr:MULTISPECIES: ABC transporter permease [unclassified Conexibacter]MDO8185793.1 hypothetical protein [Conexibacter sp. CPCC 205706]MDO8198537.1 hypothetical protein [Conexibacter sp. CPCC 205762]MDR9367623.1 hypothetical protein [Conexibacter sp. JD483]
MIPLSSLLRFAVIEWSSARLRTVFTLLAGVMGVGIICAMLISMTSISAGAREIMTSIAGTAQLQLTARSADGVDERLVTRIRAVPGVVTAAPLLEQRATIRYGDRRVGVQLVGVTAAVGDLDGITSGPLLTGLLSVPQLFLPRAVADAAGVPDRGEPVVRVETRGLTHAVAVSDVLDEPVLGPLAAAHIAGTPLARAQAWAGLPHRVSRILVRAAPGQEAAVRTHLERLAGDALQVGTVDDELALLRRASAPNDQATGLFAAIGLLVGLLLSWMAAALTLPERRRAIIAHAEHGLPRSRIAQTILFPALLLGLISGALGVGAGVLLTHAAAHDAPGYLAFAWPLSSSQPLTPAIVAASIAAGVLISVLAAALPLLELRGDPVRRALEADHDPGETIAPTLQKRFSGLSVVAIAAAAIIAIAAPSLTVLAVVLLALGTLALIPALFCAMLAIVAAWPRRDREGVSLEAVRELRSTGVRAVALCATAAIAVFGAVAVDGARMNLLNGLYEDYEQYTASGDIWITGHGDDLALQPLLLRSDQLADLPGVATARAYGGGFTDIGDRRVWIQARDAADSPIIPPSQLQRGDLAHASAQLRAGGAITLSRQLADSAGVTVGDPYPLQTPTGRRVYTVAALTTNLGWGPGAIIMPRRDYAEAWQTASPTAIEILTRPGTAPQHVIAEIRDTLGPELAAGVRIQTAAQRNAAANDVARAGLARLRQIAIILVAGAGLALGAALATTIWQRRPTWAARAFHAFPRRLAARLILLEGLLILGTGCLVGALAGLAGHWMLGRWLEATTGYPAPFSIAPVSAAVPCAILLLIALIVTAIPADRAIRAPLKLALEPDN